MAWAQIIILVFIGMNVVLHISKHGEAREPFNGPAQFLGACAEFGVLWWGGFWKPLFGG